MHLLPEQFFGTQAPNAMTVLLALFVIGAHIMLRGQLYPAWGRGVLLAVAGLVIVAVKNLVQEFVVSPDQNTSPTDLRLNAEMLEWVSGAQVLVATGYIALGISILCRWRGNTVMSLLLMTAGSASVYAALASAEWSQTFYRRAQNGGFGDYEPVSQVTHVTFWLLITTLSALTVFYWSKSRSRSTY